MKITLTAKFITENEGITCYFLEMPEVVAQGENRLIAKQNLLDALKVVMEYKTSIAPEAKRSNAETLNFKRVPEYESRSLLN